MEIAVSGDTQTAGNTVKTGDDTSRLWMRTLTGEIGGIMELNDEMRFLLVLQTACIVYDVQLGRQIAAQVVDEGIKLRPSELIVDDLGRAAMQYANYSYGQGERPNWLPK